MRNSPNRKLIIEKCIPNKKGPPTIVGKAFSVMINPASYSRTYDIVYGKEDAEGAIASEKKFSRTKSESVSFDIIFDGTGVVKTGKTGGKAEPVKKQIKSLLQMVYQYNGKRHEPNHLRLLWSNLVFYCRLKSLSIDYTMFKPGGDPLRAKAKMTFGSFMGREEEAKKKDRQSPDLMHIVEFKAGDTLPLVCHRVYEDSSYYPEVAKFNNITNIRDIKPGTKLHFPPIV